MTVAAAVSAFGLGVPLVPPSLAARGAMGEVWRVTTAEGDFALKRLFPWNAGDGAEREAAFSAQARESGVVAPVERRTPAGELLATIDGERFRAWTWVDVLPALSRPVDLGVLSEVGAVVGTLHAIAPAISEPVDQWYVSPPADDVWPAVIEAATTAGFSWATPLGRALPSLVAEAEFVRAAPALPASVCHRDLERSNVLPRAGGGLAVLDWENVGPLAPEQELGMVLTAWTSTSENLADQIATFRASYLAAGGTVRRLETHAFAAAVCTRLNFLWTQADVAIDPITGDADRAFATTVVTRILSEPGPLVAIPSMVRNW